MRTVLTAGTAAGLVSVLALSPAAADDYDFELGLSYGNESTEVTNILGIGAGGPLPEYGTFELDQESDSWTLSGSWYYSGLRDTDGPRARAEFLSRASSLTLFYDYADDTTAFNFSGSVPPAPVQPPSSGELETDTTTMGAALRHVWVETGWYAVAGAARSELDGDFGDEDGSAWQLGVGKYLGQATALDLRVVTDDGLGPDTTRYYGNLSHIGSFANGWYYGADLILGTSDDDDDYSIYGATLSLYPVRDVELGLGYTAEERYGDDEDSITAFLSWFPREAIEVRAHYRERDVDLDAATTPSYDNSGFGLGVNLRF